MSTKPGPLGQRIAAELRAELARQKHSGRWMAEQINAPHQTVARWLAGETSPGADNMDAMCRALGFQLADLVVAVQVQEPSPKVPTPRRRASDRFSAPRFLTYAVA